MAAPYPCRTTVPIAFTTSLAAVSAERLPTSAAGASSTMSKPAIQARRAYEANARALERNDAVQRRAISLGA